MLLTISTYHLIDYISDQAVPEFIHSHFIMHHLTCLDYYLSKAYLLFLSEWISDSWMSTHMLVLPSCLLAYQLTFVFVPMQQVFVSCNFCGKSISYSCSAMPHQGRGFSQYGVSGSPTKSKVTGCPGCRKPLPRCALCLMNMGTPVSNCPGKVLSTWTDAQMIFLVADRDHGGSLVCDISCACTVWSWLDHESLSL